MSPLDLHVLSTPPAFVLSQDQTLLFNPFQLVSPKISRLFALSESDFFSFSLLCIVFKDRPPPASLGLVRFSRSNPLSRGDVC